MLFSYCYVFLNNKKWKIFVWKFIDLIIVCVFQYDEVLQKVVCVIPGPRPTHIFQVIPVADSIAEEKFSQYKQNYTSTYAYHGSKGECFYSILNYGLQQHLCKVQSILLSM